MPKKLFDEGDFVQAARDLAAMDGPASVTVTSVTERLGAPVGSFYHRFASRDLLLGYLWLSTALAFQTGYVDAIESGDGLAAALHTPAWVRTHLTDARAFLLYHRDDFAHGNWPQDLKDRVDRHSRQLDAAFKRFAVRSFSGSPQDQIRLARFVLADMPIGAVGRYLRQATAPPAIVDEIIRTTYRSVMERFGSARRTRRQERRS